MATAPATKRERKGSVCTIDCLDYSAALDLIAFGGVNGRVGVLESTTLSFKGLHTAHTTDVSALYFHDAELQMVSMSIEGEIALWDAQKMEVVQVVRNKEYMTTSNVNCTCFFASSRTLLLATTKIFCWGLREDSSSRIRIDQQAVVASDFLKELR